MMLDETDLGILRALAESATASDRDIARIVGVAPAVVRDRIHRMQSAGVLQFRVELAPSRRDIGIQALALVKARPGRRREVAAALLDLDEVSHVVILAGAYDASAHLWCRDHSHLGLVHDKLESIGGIVEVATHVITGSTSQPGAAIVSGASLSRLDTVNPDSPQH